MLHFAALSCLLWTATLLTVSTVQAQWQAIGNFPAPIKCVHFLDRVSLPNIGFVSLGNGQIWRTTDGGNNWLQASAPPLPAVISNFVFRDANIGWCSVRPTNASGSCIYKTTDGGVSWSPLPIIGSVVCVALNYTSDRLFMVSWTGQASASDDLGSTWRAIGPTGMNGIDFSMPEVGIMGELRNSALLYTRDGGMTWQPSNLAVETWQPLAVQGTMNCFAIGEKTRTVYSSTDGGVLWNPVYTFSSSTSPTGQISGSLAHLYVQTSDGFYSSFDRGASWKRICGPSNFFDTRFFTRDTALYAGDPYGVLWYNPHAGQEPSLSVSNVALRFLSNDCGTSDSTLYFTFQGSCSAALVSASISGGNRQAFALQTQQYPISLSSRTGIRVFYYPTSADADTAFLTVRLQSGDMTKDTVIALYGKRITTPSYMLSAAKIEMPAKSTCTAPSDTEIVLTNTSCRSLTVVQADVNDPQQFSITSLKLPLDLQPGQSFRIACHPQSSVRGIHSAAVHCKLQYSNTALDTSIALSYRLFDERRVLYRSGEFALANECSALDTIVLIHNPLCDTLSIDSVSAQQGYAVQIGSLLQKRIAPGESLRVPIHVAEQAAGVYSLGISVRCNYHGDRFDTMFTQRYRVLQALQPALVFKASCGAFDSVSLCETKQRIVEIRNPLCNPILLKKVTLSDQSTGFALPSAVANVQLLSDSVLRIPVQFVPQHVGEAKVQLRLTMQHGITQLDTVIPLTARSYVVMNVSGSEPLHFPKQRLCDNATKEITIYNNSCEAITVQNTNLYRGKDFIILATPASIAANDSAKVKVGFIPDLFGEMSDTMAVTVRDQVGTERNLQFPLSGSAVEASRQTIVSTTSIAMKRLQACASADTSFYLVNNTPCDTLRIDKVVSDNPAFAGITVLGGLPRTLRTGDTLGMLVHLTPQHDGEDHSMFHIAGNAFDTTVQLTGSLAASGKSILTRAAVSSSYQTTFCQTLTQQFVVSNTGCFEVDIDSVTISGDSHFAVTQMPFQLHLRQGMTDSIAVSFGADEELTHHAVLTVWGDKGKIVETLSLDGRSADTRTPIALQLGNDRIEKVRAGEVHSITFRTQQPVTAPIDRITFTVHYNDNFLTFLHGTALQGWQVQTIDSIYNGRRVELVRTGTEQPLDSLFTASFYTTITDSVQTTVSIDDLVLNAGDPTLTGCVVKLDEATPVVTYVMEDSCADGLIRRAMSGRLAVDGIELYPNPATVNTTAAVRVHSTEDNAYVKLALINEAGRGVQEIGPFSLVKGNNDLTLPLHHVPSGAYLLKVVGEHSSATIKVIVK